MQLYIFSVLVRFFYLFPFYSLIRIVTRTRILYEQQKYEG